jgi:oligosaccharide repeat unit polymerase
VLSYRLHKRRDDYNRFQLPCAGAVDLTVTLRMLHMTKQTRMIYKLSLLYIILSFFILYINRYRNIGVQQFQFISYSSLSVVIYYWGIKKYVLILNPISLFSLFITIIAFSFLRFSSTQSVLGNRTLIVLNIAIIGFLLPFALSKKILLRQSGRTKIGRWWSGRSLHGILFFTSVISFSLTVAFNGSFPFFDSLRGTDSYSTMRLIPFVHYFVMMSAILPAVALLYYRSREIKRSELFISVVSAVFIMLNIQSRQLLLLTFLVFIYALMFDSERTATDKKNNRTIITFIGSFVVLFLLLGEIRVGAADIREYMRAAARIDNFPEISLIEMWFNLYGPQNITTLNEFLSVTPERYDFYYGKNLFRPIVSVLFLDRIGYINYPPALDGNINLATYVWEPYQDFGIIGIAIFSLTIGLVSKTVFESYRERRSIGSVVRVGISSFCILMSSFTNYYYTFFVWFILVISFLLPARKQFG